MSEVAPVDAGESGPAARPPVDAALDEAEHQAFDLLAELPLAEPWSAARRGENARANLTAALEQHGETLDAIVAAEAIVGAALERITARVARSLIDAATRLASSTEAGSLTSTIVTEARAALEAEPSLGATLGAARETAGLCLGLEPGSIAAALLDVLGEDGQTLVEPAWDAFAAALDDRIHAAWASEDSPATAIPLRVFRNATVVDAGVGIRARALAADDPEQLGLAEALVRQIEDPQQLVEHFERARAAASERPKEPAPDEPEMDGPKRKFTPGHLALALLILGLTLWHYLWR